MRKYFSPEEIKKMSLEEMLDNLRSPVEPEYTRSNTNIVDNLFYSWHGFASENSVFPENTEALALSLKNEWRKDGFKLLKVVSKPRLTQILCEVSPEVAPVDFTRKIKGRLDHVMRKAGTPMRFSRAVGFRALGANTSRIVSRYVAGQPMKEDVADERFREVLKQFTKSNDDVSLIDAMKTNRGRYWYNLHLVMVAADRNIRISKDETFNKITMLLPKIAGKHECEISDQSIMPDHLHIALKGNPKLSPAEIGLSFLNNLWYALKLGRVWRGEIYVGTFSEYALSQIGINPRK